MAFEKWRKLDPFGHWLAGFVDGEGCFALRPSVNNSLVCTFNIALRDDDTDILLEIKEWMQVGAIYTSTPPSTGRGRTIFRVARKDEVPIVVDVFDTYPLRAKKARDFTIWKEAVLLWTSSKEPWKRQDPRLWELADELQQVREYRKVS